MSSSTSSSKVTPGGRGRAVRIALMLLIALSLIEAGTREALVPTSQDLSRYRSYPGRARSLVAAPAPRIVFIGNSVTQRVPLDVMKSEWQARTGAELSVDKFVAYYSTLTTWYWMAVHYFLKQDLKPDLIVVTYYDGNGLADSEVMEVVNLAQFFTDADDRPSLFAYDLTTLEQRADYLLSSVSQAFAARDRIRDITLNLIPGYRAFATATNSLNFQYEHRRRLGAANPIHTYRTLHRFVDRARREGVQVCFVAYPNRPERPGTIPYELDPEVLEAIAEAEMLHVDLRRVDGLSFTMYEDEVHLNAEGRPVYTQKFTEELAKIWQPR